MADNLISPPTITSVQQDMDRDGIPERWNVSMRIRKPALTSGVPSDLIGGTIVLGFDYETQQTIKMDLYALAVVRLENLPSGGKTSVKKVKTIGTLELQ